MNTAQKRVALVGISVILLTALVPFAVPLVICVPLVAAVLTFAAPEPRLYAVPPPVRPALVAIRTSQHLPRAALPRLHR